MMTDGAHSLKERTLYIHPMTRAGARMIAASFRAAGLDARILPPSDQRTLELGNMVSSGEECLPEKVTIGDYLKVTEQPGFDPSKTAFIMPTANGPCRFGQYSHLLGAILKRRGLEEVMIVSPSSKNGYGDLGSTGTLSFFRSAWLGVIASDILRKLLLKTRPYARNPETVDRLYEAGLERAETVIAEPGLSQRRKIGRLQDTLVATRNEFRAIEADYIKGKPLIGVVGEIFCRHNRFANQDMLRLLEAAGAETWIADVGEWVFYTDWSRMDSLRRLGKKVSLDMGTALLKRHVMHSDEHKLLAPFADDFVGYEEPGANVLVELGRPYLPADGALGEMALSLGRSAYLYGKGADGIVDISPFSCMNGIVSEAVYPSFSRDHDGIPCQVFYYDGNSLDMDRDIGIFMELVRGYMNRKRMERRYPAFFG